MSVFPDPKHKNAANLEEGQAEDWEESRRSRGANTSVSGGGAHRGGGCGGGDDGGGAVCRSGHSVEGEGAVST